MERVNKTKPPIEPIAVIQVSGIEFTDDLVAKLKNAVDVIGDSNEGAERTFTILGGQSAVDDFSDVIINWQGIEYYHIYYDIYSQFSGGLYEPNETSE